MEIQFINEQDISPACDENIRQGLCVCFPADAEIFQKSRAWHGSAPAWSVIVPEAGGVIAHVGIVDRVIRVGEQSIRVAGVQNVFVLPQWRARGLCDAVMNAAMSKATDDRFDVGLLHCLPQLEKVYARYGWLRLPKESIIRIDETGRENAMPDKSIAMFFPIEIREFPAGTIYLQGNDW